MPKRPLLFIGLIACISSPNAENRFRPDEFDQPQPLFERLPQALGEMGSMAVALGDVDNDGDLDIYFANMGMPGETWTGAPDQIWLNEGNRSPRFVPSQMPFPPYITQDVKLVDLDGDGDLDIVAATNEHVSIYRNDSSRRIFFALSQLIPARSSIFAIAVGDLDGDGDADIVTGCAGENLIFWNGGIEGELKTGVFDFDGMSLEYSYATRDIELGDMDSDGDLDIVEINAYAKTNLLYVNGLVPEGRFKISYSRKFGAPSSGAAAALADFNNDGAMDVFMAGNQLFEYIQIWQNVSIRPLGLQKKKAPRQDVQFNGVAVDDFDGDGLLDAAVISMSDYPTLIYKNVSQGTIQFEDVKPWLSNSKAHDIAVGDMNGDGHPDLVIASSGSNEVWINQSARSR